jgi:predicted Zn-dependent peptidase
MRRLLLLGVLGVLCGYVVSVLTVAIGRAQTRPDRSTPPSIGQAPELDLAPIQKRSLSNGIPVWIVETREVPLVQVNLLVLAGSDQDPAGKFGIASVTAAMLDEGAGSKSALEIADHIEFLGATLATTSSFDTSAVRLNVPRARLEEALPTMADVALRPTFPQQELERLRQERLTSLLQARDDPASVSGMAFNRILYGATHRYGTAAIGTAAALRGFTPADLQTFHQSVYQPANSALIVVGDIQPEAAVTQLEKHFGAWRGGGTVARRAVPSAPQVRERRIYIVDMPGAEQSVIRIGWIGVPRSTRDYFTLQVLNTVLGGAFTSRLNQNLRERNGYAYGASSGFDMRLSAGPFSARAAVQADKTAEALREFFNELAAIAQPIPADELEKARNYITLGFPSQFEATGDLSAQLEELIVYKLPEDYFENYVSHIRAVTAADVQKAAAAYVEPQRFAVVVVGDRKTIEANVRALKLGPVQVMTVEEALGE